MARFSIDEIDFGRFHHLSHSDYGFLSSTIHSLPTRNPKGIFFHISILEKFNKRNNRNRKGKEIIAGTIIKEKNKPISGCIWYKYSSGEKGIFASTILSISDLKALRNEIREKFLSKIFEFLKSKTNFDDSANFLSAILTDEEINQIKNELLFQDYKIWSEGNDFARSHTIVINQKDETNSIQSLLTTDSGYLIKFNDDRGIQSFNKSDVQLSDLPVKTTPPNPIRSSCACFGRRLWDDIGSYKQKKRKTRKKWLELEPNPFDELPGQFPTSHNEDWYDEDSEFTNIKDISDSSSDNDHEEEFWALVEEMKPYGFTSSKEVSAHIRKYKLGHKYPNLSGELKFEQHGQKFSMHGGISPEYYHRLCLELNVHNQSSTARVVDFTSYASMRYKK